jgi:hypothetical protein
LPDTKHSFKLHHDVFQGDQLAVTTDKVDPGDLGVNLRFKGSQVIHPKARAAQAKLVKEIQKHIQGREQGYDVPEGACYLSLVFYFSSRRFDVDGPVKRTMDALEKALKGLTYEWNDRRVGVLRVEKQMLAKPGISLYLRPIGPWDEVG